MWASGKKVVAGGAGAGFDSYFKTKRITTSQNIAGAWEKIQFNGEEYDNLNEYDPSTNHRFTASEAGKYQFNVTIFQTTPGTAQYVECMIQLNGGGT